MSFTERNRALLSYHAINTAMAQQASPPAIKLNRGAPTPSADKIRQTTAPAINSIRIVTISAPPSQP